MQRNSSNEGRPIEIHHNLHLTAWYHNKDAKATAGSAASEPFSPIQGLSLPFFSPLNNDVSMKEVDIK